MHSYRELLELEKSEVFHAKVDDSWWKGRVSKNPNFVAFQREEKHEDNGIKLHISLNLDQLGTVGNKVEGVEVLDKTFAALMPILAESKFVHSFKMIHISNVKAAISAYEELSNLPESKKKLAEFNRIYNGAQLTIYLTFHPDDSTNDTLNKFAEFVSAIETALDKANVTPGRVPRSDVVFSKSVSGRYDPSHGNVSQYKPAEGISDVLESLRHPFFRAAFLHAVGEEFKPLVDKMIELSKEKSILGGELDKVAELYKIIIKASQMTPAAKIDFLKDQKNNPILIKPRNLPKLPSSLPKLPVSLPSFFKKKSSVDALDETILLIKGKDQKPKPIQNFR